jgi:hypothetical protein
MRTIPIDPSLWKFCQLSSVFSADRQPKASAWATRPETLSNEEAGPDDGHLKIPKKGFPKTKLPGAQHHLNLDSDSLRL